MEFLESLAAARDAITVKRVYGEPYERNGVTVIPAAAVQGGGGGGGGEQGAAKSAGTGFGIQARPVGAFVIRGDEVSWQPAVDANRAIFGGQLLGLVALLVLRAIATRRR